MNIISLNDKLFYIGGIVRDELLGRENIDVDVTYEGNAIEFAKSLDGAEILKVNEPFATVEIKIDGKIIDLASTRSEIYPKKGHLPVIQKIGCSLKEDVLRRDFTVNALAKNLKTGEVFDYVNGLDDLKNKKLNVLHDMSFADDPTRIIRGLKFAVRFGFELGEHTKKLQDEYLENVNYDMSFKRLKDELVSAFNINKLEVLDKFIEQKMYRLLSDKSFLLPKYNVQMLLDKYKKEVKTPWIVYLGGFDLSNLNFTRNEKIIIENYKKLGVYETDFDIYKAFSNLSIESLLIYAVFKKPEIVLKYLEKLRYIKLEITGADIINLGFNKGKKIAEVLDEVLKAKLSNPDMDKKEEIVFAKTLM